MRRKKTILTGVIALLLALTGTFIGYMVLNQNQKSNVDSYDKCAAAGYPILDSYPERCAAPSGKTYMRVITEDVPISLEGYGVCLLHKNTDGPQTMECAMGIKTDQGKYYALTANTYDIVLSVAERKVRVNGTLKNNLDSIYQSEGTISVTSYEFLD